MRPWLAGLLGGACIVVAATAAPPGPGDESESSVIAPRASRSLLLDVASVDGTVLAVGERGHILRSRDKGATWSQLAAPTRATLTAVHMRDARSAWVVGHDAVILRTTDGGDTWERVHHDPEGQRPLLDVWFADESRGLAVGAYSLYLVTADGGKTWSEAPLEIAEEPAPGAEGEAAAAEGEEGGAGYKGDDELISDFHLHHIARSGSGPLYMAAEAGTLYRSDDVGATWKPLESPYEGSFFGVLPLEGDSVLFFGLRGHLFRSDDGGATFQPIETGTEALLDDAVRLDASTVVVAGLDGVLLVSRDAGRTFGLRVEPDRRGFAAAAPTGDGGMVLVGEGGVKTLPPGEISAEVSR